MLSASLHQTLDEVGPAAGVDDRDDHRAQGFFEVVDREAARWDQGAMIVLRLQREEIRIPRDLVGCREVPLQEALRRQPATAGTIVIGPLDVLLDEGECDDWLAGHGRRRMDCRSSSIVIVPVSPRW